MSSEPIVAIMNPTARYGKCKLNATRAFDFLRSKNIEIRVRETEAKGHGSQIAKEEYDSGVRQFISVGGDGTHHEIINGLYPASLNAKEKPTLSFFPFGTGNSFLRDFIKNVESYNAENYLTAKEYPCDVVRIKHTKGEIYFINIVGFGFVADACIVRNKYFKKLYNFGYILAVLIKTIPLKTYDYSINWSGQESILKNLIFMSICNSRYTGGDMLIAPDARVDDGLVDVITVEKVSRLKLLSVFPKIFSGKHIYEKEIKIIKANHLDFNFKEEIPVMFDGEMVYIQPQSMTVLPNALTLKI